ncbi:hypothetical protein [Campylobacter sp. RM16187]|uniref:hypothetical protein n=1 Tax=Campylobacter sp. RM16187 TaxID=1660063 RepID=UPI0021B530FA|nr:hypothetical protein [Campylobacter sp. RM16187]QKG28523.1 hypothetical protein CDOMF_0233 [Campylobacter sp. RM16187]
MVKKIIAFALAASFAFGANVLEIVDGILGQTSANTTALFGDGLDYLDEDGRPNIAKISNTLKSNSLFPTSYKEKINLDIQFISSQANPLLLIKIVKEALNSLGFNEILTTEFANTQATIWGIRLNTKFMLDPGSLYTAFKNTNTIIQAIERTDTFTYKYALDTSKSILNLTAVEIGKEIELSKPLEPYFIDVSDANKVEITAKNGDSWFALVRILDKNLNLIDEKRKNKKTTKINFILPSNAKYITIDDANSLENIKRGLRIHIQ